MSINIIFDQGVTKHVGNIQMYTNKFGVYAKFLKFIQSFVHQYTFTFFCLLWLSFFHWQKIILCFFISIFWLECLDNVYCSTNVSTILIKFTVLTFFSEPFFLWTYKWINVQINLISFIEFTTILRDWLFQSWLKFQLVKPWWDFFWYDKWKQF